MARPVYSCRMSDEPIRVQLDNPDIILMQRPESPALVHGQLARDAHPGLEPLWDDADGTKGNARVERRGEDPPLRVTTACIGRPALPPAAW